MWRKVQSRTTTSSSLTYATICTHRVAAAIPSKKATPGCLRTYRRSWVQQHIERACCLSPGMKGWFGEILRRSQGVARAVTIWQAWLHELDSLQSWGDVVHPGGSLLNNPTP